MLIFRQQDVEHTNTTDYDMNTQGNDNGYTGRIRSPAPHDSEPKEKRYGKNQKFKYSHNAGCCGIPLIYRFNFAGSDADKPVSF